MRISEVSEEEIDIGTTSSDSVSGLSEANSQIKPNKRDNLLIQDKLNNQIIDDDSSLQLDDKSL